MEDLLKRFKNFIKGKGLKYTSEREEILQEILNFQGHFDVEELFLRLQEKKKKISKASIYRSIPLFIEAGLIQEVYRQDGHAHYELTVNRVPHLHFLCMKCGKVVEVEDPVLEKIIREKEKERGFKLLSHHLESIGICDACQREDILTLDKVEKGSLVEVLDFPDNSICQKLSAMGLVKGSKFKVIQICGRTMLLERENIRIALSKEVASQIFVRLIEVGEMDQQEEISCHILEGQKATSLCPFFKTMKEIPYSNSSEEQ